MPKDNRITRIITVLSLICFLHLTLFPGGLSAQSAGCTYDKNNPSLENARISFKVLDYDCAEAEIKDYLAREEVTIEEKADAHVLLAAVYYAKVKGENEKRDRVIEQFKKAFKAYRDWRGELDISSTEFFEMMQSAKREVETENKELEQQQLQQQQQEQEKPPAQKEKVEEKKPPTTTISEKPKEDKGGKKKAWYSNWWAIALGVGVVAGVAVAVAGGGSSGGDSGGGGTTVDTLSGFPGPPPGK